MCSKKGDSVNAMRKIIHLILIVILLVSCSPAKTDKVGEKETKQNTEQITEQNNIQNEETVHENTNEEQILEDEEHMLGGRVIVIEDDNIIRVEAETNLIEGTEVQVNVVRAFGILSMPIGQVGSAKGEVGPDGTVTIDYELDDDFFENYNGLHVEVKIEVMGTIIPENVRDTYGEHGENFKGPFVYQFELFEQEQKLYAPVYILVGDERTEYPIETPERAPLPDDYGETDVWIEAEVVDNDHQYLYVEGRTNLLEGVQFTGDYFSDEEASFSQELYSTKMHVEPDGTFFLPVRYKSITEDGYIKIHSAPIRTHRTTELIYETYGENFEKLTGDVVKKVDEHQEIELILKTEGMDIAAPENSLVTEHDGELKINVPDEVLFDFDKSDLKKEAKSTLDEVINILESLEDGQEIKIYGHTDNKGADDYNLKLSEERAKSVESYLKKFGDIDHLTLTVKGFGKTKPIASNEDDDGRAQNRRVEIIFQADE